MARDGRLYVHTNLDAPRGRIAVTDPTAPGVEHWTTLLAEDPTAVLEDVAFIDGGGDDTTPTLLLASWRRHSVSEVSAHDPRTGGRLPDAVTLPGLGSISGLVTRPDGGAEVWFSYTDHTTPTSVHRFDARTGETTLWASPPGLVADLPDVRARQIEVTSPDGTTVRAFVVARTDALDADGRPLATAPTILYGYGGFEISLDPGVLGDHARVGGGRRRVRRRQPARRWRGGRAVAPRRHAGPQAERVRRLPRRRRPPRRRRAGPRPDAAGVLRAAPTAACSSVPR